MNLRHSPSTFAASSEARISRASLKSPGINWEQLYQWYQAILTAGQNWRSRVRDSQLVQLSRDLVVEHEAEIEANITESNRHLRRILLKATEKLLRRPGRPLISLENCRFLFLLLENPLLYAVRFKQHESRDMYKFEGNKITVEPQGGSHGVNTAFSFGRDTSRCHASVIKRLVGLIANLSHENHRSLISIFARYTRDDLNKLVELVGGFVTQRLMRQRRGITGSQHQGLTSVLVPEIAGNTAGTSAQLYTALSTATRPSISRAQEGRITYHEDWQIKAAAKVMSLLFQANNISGQRRHLATGYHSNKPGRPILSCQYESTQGQRITQSLDSMAGINTSAMLLKRKQVLPNSVFYNSMLDYCDLVADFEVWESRQKKFSFCQYPIFLSIWAKIQIFEYDARRQMETKARQAFFNSITNRRAVSQYLVLKVRRECMVEDSLRGVSAVVGSGQDDIKKGLRIAFQGEEGVDAGG